MVKLRDRGAGRVSGVVVIALIVCVIFALWAVVNPRSIYWTLTAWQYRHPDAVEPSDAAYTASRVSGVIMLVMIVGFAIWYGVMTAEVNTEQQTHDNCQNVLQPALSQKIRAGSVTQAEMQNFATEYGLTLTVTSSNTPTFDPTHTPVWPPAEVAVPTYHFQQNGRDILTWTDDGFWNNDPTCRV